MTSPLVVYEYLVPWRFLIVRSIPLLFNRLIVGSPALCSVICMPKHNPLWETCREKWPNSIATSSIQTTPFLLTNPTLVPTLLWQWVNALPIWYYLQLSVSTLKKIGSLVARIVQFSCLLILLIAER